MPVLRASATLTYDLPRRWRNAKQQHQQLYVRTGAPGQVAVRLLARVAAGARGAQELGGAAGALPHAQHLRHQGVRQAERRV